MFPADLYQYFDIPTETTVPTPGGTVVQLCKADPTRVVLIIGTAGGATLQLSTKNDVGATGGFIVAQDNQPFVLMQSRHGSLAQQAWFAGPSMVIENICVIELFLRRKPE